jgi:ferredoxin
LQTFQLNIKLKFRKMAYKITNECTACGSCISECPVEAIKEGDIYKIDPETCTDCGACADVCPVAAILPE